MAKRKTTIVRATVDVFYCGSGDTILVKLGECWGLIDCNLTRSSGAGDRLRAHLRTHKVKKLAFVCISHPDLDHLRGLKKLLEEQFTSGSGEDKTLSVERFWDCGADLAVLATAARRLGKPLFAEELEVLYHELTPMLRKERWHSAAVGGMLLVGDLEGFTVVSLGPAYERVAIYRQDKVEQLLVNADVLKHASGETNELSVVLAFHHKKTGASLLFLGDAPTECVGTALAGWDEIGKLLCGGGIVARPWRTFTAVKIGHHGAWNSHDSRVFEEYCTKGETLAIISAREGDPDHPHPDVVRDLKTCGIRVVSTCPLAEGLRSATRGVCVVGHAVRKEAAVADVRISIHDDGSITYRKSPVVVKG